MLHKMCTNPSKQEFDNLYENLVEIDDVIKAWLEVEPKKNKLSYDSSGRPYGNIIMNLS